MSIFKRTHTVFALIVLHIIFGVLVFKNVSFGTYFIGWDAINPEFNFGINFARVLSAFWQENYGTGTLTGHGFASLLPHTLITYFLSLFLAARGVRIAFTFFCLYLGALGMFVLSHKLLRLAAASLSHPRDDQYSQGSFLERLTQTRISVASLIQTAPWVIPYAALISSLFYMLNLGTVQIFYVQLEAFIAHFAALPWLFWVAIRLLEKRSNVNFLLFFVINFFATLQGFIPSLFISYIIGLTLLLAAYIFDHRFSSIVIKRAFLLFIFTLLINAYWLFPLAGYQLSHNTSFLNSYNNLISTPHFIDLSKKYGDFSDVVQLKGYLFNAYELNGFVLAPWVNHQTIFVTALSYLFFIIGLCGLVLTFFLLRKSVYKAFAALYIFFFINMATNIPPLSFLILLLQKLSSTYQQAFRTTFTKFSIGLSFSYSLFLGLGILFLLAFVSRYKKQRALLLTIALSIFLLAYYSLPAFAGHLFYKKLFVSIPRPYFEIMDYFKSQPDGRIADFPQDCPEGWYAYNWGYFGSGFYWYGVRQPFLARAFDVWSGNNENYYWQITRALRAQEYDKIDALFDKYNVTWILYDPNIISCRDQKVFFTDKEFLNHLKNSSKYHLEAIFTDNKILPIFIFKNNSHSSQTFADIKAFLPNVGPQTSWTDNDQAFFDNGSYITTLNSPFASYYPFSLFTKRKARESDFDISVAQDEVIFKKTLPRALSGYTFVTRPYNVLEKNLPFELTVHPATGGASFSLTFLFPDIYLDGQKLVDSRKTISLGQIQSKDTSHLRLFVNGAEVTQSKENTYRATFFFDLTNTITVTDDSLSPLFSWRSDANADYRQVAQENFSFTLPRDFHGEFEIRVPKVKDDSFSGIEFFSPLEIVTPEACDDPNPLAPHKFEFGRENENEYVRLISQNNGQCANIFLPRVASSFAYLAEIKARNVAGQNPKFLIYNKSNIAFNEVILPLTKDFTSLYFVIPPTFKNEVGYSLQFKNKSENNDVMINDLAGISFWQIPYAFLKDIHFNNPKRAEETNTNSRVQSVSHPTETLYVIDAYIQGPSTLTLGQSFDPGWKAYEVKNSNILTQAFPFLFGRAMKSHVMINDWENGWVLPTPTGQNATFVIVYLPQYLEYAGFTLLALYFPLLFFLKLKRKA